MKIDDKFLKIAQDIQKGFEDQGLDLNADSYDISIDIRGDKKKDKPLTNGQKTIIAMKRLLTGRVESGEDKINLMGLENFPMDDYTDSDFSEEEVTKIVRNLLNIKGPGGFSLKGLEWGRECYIVAEKKESLSDVYPSVISLSPYPAAEDFHNLRVFEKMTIAELFISRIKKEGFEEERKMAENLAIYKCQLIVQEVAEKETDD